MVKQGAHIGRNFAKVVQLHAGRQNHVVHGVNPPIGMFRQLRDYEMFRLYLRIVKHVLHAHHEIIYSVHANHTVQSFVHGKHLRMVMDVHIRHINLKFGMAFDFANVSRDIFFGQCVCSDCEFSAIGEKTQMLNHCYQRFNVVFR